MKANADLVVMQGAGLNVGYLAMNTQKKPFDSVHVRRAINHALNKQAYVDAIYLGNAMVAKNPLPPTIWSYNKQIKDYAYNIKKAKKLLKKAGYPAGFETEIWTLPVTRPYNPNGKKMGEMMQADLAKIGLKIKLITYEWGTYLKKSKQGKHDLIQLGWTSDNGDPDNFLDYLLSCDSIPSGQNIASWCSKEFSALTKTAKEVMAELRSYNIGTRPFFYPMHKQPIFNRMGLFLEDDLPNSENLYEKGFYIPSGLTLTNKEMLEVSIALHKVLL